jgi:hypothetical protein
MIIEIIVTTRAADGHTHIAPMGLRRRDGRFLLAPFKPSSSLDNMRREGSAIINYTDDVRVFAGCLTGHWDWPLCPAVKVSGQRLQDCLSHVELQLEHVREDEQRPELLFRPVYEETHAPFCGFNRAQSAVIEAEIAYLGSAIEKTAGPREQLAWDWLLQRINSFYAAQAEERQA